MFIRDWRARRQLARQAAYSAEVRQRLSSGWYAERLKDVGLDVRYKRVLDVGCGAGGWSRAAADGGASVVVAGDIDRASVVATRDSLHAARPGHAALCIQFDGCNLPIRDRSCDLLISHVVAPYVDDETKFIAEIARVLREGGQLYVTGHGPGLYLRGLLRGGVLALKPLIWTALALLELAPRSPERWQLMGRFSRGLQSEGLVVTPGIESRFLGLPSIVRWVGTRLPDA